MPPPQPQDQEDHGGRKIWCEKAQSKIIFVMYHFVLCLLVSFPIWIFPLIARHACHALATSHVWRIQSDGSCRCFCHKRSRTTSWAFAWPFGRVSKSACDKVQFMVNMCHHFFLAPTSHICHCLTRFPRRSPRKDPGYPKRGSWWKSRSPYIPSALCVDCLDTCCPDVQSYLIIFWIKTKSGNCFDWGVFGATTKANPNYLSVRGCRDWSCCNIFAQHWMLQQCLAVPVDSPPKIMYCRISQIRSFGGVIMAQPAKNLVRRKDW